MLFRITLILIVILIIASSPLFAQKSSVLKDSILVYKTIENYSKKSKVRRYIYQLIFNPIAINTTRKKVPAGVVQKSYKPFEGKIIRHINIETLDPFGYSVSDTAEQSLNAASKAGNRWHVKSRGITIRNLLLVRQNQLFDSMRVKESERLVRSSAYVHDVSFLVKAASKSSDSVDIYIRELDNWSIAPTSSPSPTNLNLSVTDKNFLGLGHEFQNGFTWFHSKGELSHFTNYYIPNIRNSYVNSTLHYGKDQYGSFIKSAAVDRPFFSPLAKWAGGASFLTNFKIDSVKDISGRYVPLHTKYNIQDFWAGKAIRIFKGNAEADRVTNLIFTGRYYRISYLEKSPWLYDPYHIYTSEDFYFGGAGISTRKYVQDRFIFNSGVIEDVPVGKVYALIGGYQVKNHVGRYYLGARVLTGAYHSWGYLSSNLEYGTFFHESNPEQGALTGGINYFTKLIEIGKWKFRQFVKPQFTIGFNRLPCDSLTLNRGYGIGGFNSLALRGTQRMMFNFQTQSYAPWNFVGFSFGPYLLYSMGMLGDEANGFKNNKMYSQIGLGVLVKNRRFVFNTFQFSLSYYPQIPGKGEDMIKFNAFKTTDFGFRDFEIGRPAPVIYQ